MTSHLKLALEATAADAQLEKLLEAWRERPLERTATLIRTVARSVPGELEQVLGAIVGSRREVSMPKLEALEDLPDDPRIAHGLLAIARARPFTSDPHRPFWTQLFRELSRRADRTTLPTIAELQEGAGGGVTSFDQYLRTKLIVLARRVESRESLTPTSEELALLDALDAKYAPKPPEVAAAKTADDFLADIYAHPLDDGPREVFADWLLERNDERGELITLQMGRARGVSTPVGTKRERELLSKHGRAWMGPLEPAIHGTVFRFEKGFLFSCKIAWKRLLTTPGLKTHRAWATVREYDLDSAGERDADEWLDHMIALGAKRR